MLWHRTQSALAELMASGQLSRGDHQGSVMSYSGGGYVAGEVPFDLSMHDVANINPFSLSSSLSGRHFVDEVIPDRPVNMGLLIHADLAERHDPEWVVQAKQHFVSTLRDVLHHSLPGNEDTIDSFVIGDPDSPLISRDSLYLKKTDQPEKAAKTVAEFAREGLTVVISSFRQGSLPLSGVRAANFRRSTVGIKANHLFDVALQPNTGKWATGNPQKPEVDTDKRNRKELLEFNKEQWILHLQIMSHLGGLGLSMAQAIFDPRYKPYNYNLADSDQSLALAFSQLSRK